VNFSFSLVDDAAPVAFVEIAGDGAVDVVGRAVTDVVVDGAETFVGRSITDVVADPLPDLLTGIATETDTVTVADVLVDCTDDFVACSFGLNTCRGVSSVPEAK